MDDQSSLTLGRQDDDEQWHGVYLVQFSNRCSKVGYSTEPQNRVYGLARMARNFRIDVESVQIRIIGTDVEALEVEAALLFAFGKVATGVEAREYFYGVQGLKGQRLFERVCSTYERTRSGRARRRAAGEAAWAALKPRSITTDETDLPRPTTPETPAEASWAISGAHGEAKGVA